MTLSMNRLYFDYNASAPLASGLVDQLHHWLREDLKNPNSAHSEGQRAKTVIESARKTISKHLNLAHHDKLIFNSGGTEANNTVLASAFHTHFPQKKALVLTKVEHSCVYNYAQWLSLKGVELRYIEVDRFGQIDFDQYASLLDENVFLVSVMLAQNETGFVFPVKSLAEKARACGALFHTDAVCALGKLPIDFQDLGVDFLTFSSHKFGALKGSGGLAIRGDVKNTAYIYGGPQELERRAGTQNVLGIASSAFALDVHAKNLAEEANKCAQLRSQFKTIFKELWPQSFVIESFQNLPQTLSVVFSGLSGNVLLTSLDLEGVSVSYGSACASGSLEISRVIRELGLPFSDLRSVIRISFGPQTTENDVQEFGRRLQRVLQRMSS